MKNMKKLLLVASTLALTQQTEAKVCLKVGATAGAQINKIKDKTGINAEGVLKAHNVRLTQAPCDPTKVANEKATVADRANAIELSTSFSGYGFADLELMQMENISVGILGTAGVADISGEEKTDHMDVKFSKDGADLSAAGYLAFTPAKHMKIGAAVGVSFVNLKYSLKLHDTSSIKHDNGASAVEAIKNLEEKSLDFETGTNAAINYSIFASYDFTEKLSMYGIVRIASGSPKIDYKKSTMKEHAEMFADDKGIDYMACNISLGLTYKVM